MSGLQLLTWAEAAARFVSGKLRGRLAGRARGKLLFRCTTAGAYLRSLLRSRHIYISINIIHTENVSEGCTHRFGTERIKLFVPADGVNRVRW